MLYPTHKRFGILWGLLFFPIGIFIGMIPIMSIEATGNEVFMVLICCYFGMRGALFGAEFPDIDSHTSIPRKKHPLIGKIFDACGVKHRGKYSHDFFSIGLTFGIIYFIVTMVGDNFITSVASGSSIMGFVAYAGMLIFVWLTAVSVIDFLKWIANVMKNKQMWARVNGARWGITIIVGILMTIFLTFTGIFSFKNLFGTIPMTQSIQSAMILVASLKMYIAFTLVGAYSHLFADMITKQGVSIFFIRLQPMGIVVKVRKIPLIGKFLVPLDPKTGGAWENLVRLVVTIACVPASIIAVYALGGLS